MKNKGERGHIVDERRVGYLGTRGGGIPGIEGNSLFEESLFCDNSGHFKSDKKTDLKHRSQVLI